MAKKKGMKNWKTTMFGVLQAAALGYAGVKTGNPEFFVGAAAALGQGLAAKDANVTGGTVQQ